MFKKLFGLYELKNKIEGLEESVRVKDKMLKDAKEQLELSLKSAESSQKVNDAIFKIERKENRELKKRLSTAASKSNFSIKSAIERNIKASENERDYFTEFLGKEKLISFADFYRNNRIELEDISNQILRNFLRAADRDSKSYSAAQEVVEAYMSFFAGSYQTTITPKEQAEKEKET